MNNLPVIYGEGKKGKSPPINDPANLVSKQALYLLMVVSEGELTSIEDIYLNDTSITNFSASFAFTFGETNQAVIPGLNATTVAEGFSLPLTNTAPDGVVRPILGSFEYVDVTIQLNALYLINRWGDNTRTTVNFAVYTSPSSILPVYSLVATPSIYGKAVQPYLFTFRVGRPAGNDGVAEWQIKILRTSADADSNYVSESTVTTLTYYSTDIVSTYPGSALIAVRIEDAAQLGGGLPQLSFRGRGIKLMLPDSTYYDAANKLYRNIANTAWVSPTDVTRATWGGNFNQVAGACAPQYSNNLSWAIYNILSDWLSFTVDGIRYPRGLDIPKEYLAKYAFEEFARYCDETIYYQDPLTLVVTGEPRYTLNRQFFERKSAKYARDEMLSVGNAELIETGGLVSIIWDKRFSEAEVNASPIFTNQNVIDGMFEYASSDIAENYTQINITIQEIDNRNRTRTLVIQASGLETFLGLTAGHFNSLYQYQTSDFLVLGTASVAAGIRKGRTLLWDALMVDLAGDGVVQFKSLIEAALLTRGSLIRISDSAMYNTIETGRIVSYISNISSIAITLDRAITLTGVTNLLVYKNDGTVVELTLVETSGTVTNVSSASFGSLVLIQQSIFVQKTSRVTLYKVVNITHDSDGYTIEAIKYDARKYDYVDSQVTLPTASSFTEIGLNRTPAVTAITVSDVPNTDITNKHFVITWSHTTLPDRIYNYQVEWGVSTGQTGAEVVSIKQFDFIQVVTIPEAVYTFTITAMSSLDLPSLPVTYSFKEVRWDSLSTWDSGTHWDSLTL